ncbi:MAG TPA: type II secretion system minor pseudopilin GspI [Gammaproteobacteria bacterium]
MIQNSARPSIVRGFTLLEVMVALAVVAIALAALVKGGSQSAVTAAHLRDKSFAHWVAMNRVAELRLQKEWPATGDSGGDEEMANRRWYTLAKVIATEDPDLRRVEVEVRTSDDKDGAVLARVIAFLPRPDSGGP